jgi:hypothetical protein
MNNKKYLKVMFDTKSRYNDFEYQINKENVANKWNPNATTPEEMGGFNFSCEEKVVRWLHNGDTIYDVLISNDAEVINVKECATPNGVFRSNKIILTNPRKVTDDMALEFYNKSTIPEKAYSKTLGSVAIMGYDKTARKILNDKVNKGNIDLYINEWNDFINKSNRKNSNKTVKYIEKQLINIKNSNI